MAFNEREIVAMECIKAGVQDGNLCLAECKDRKTGERIVAVCGAVPVGDGEIMMVPVAKLFEGSPFEELEPAFTKSDEDLGQEDAA